MTASLSANSKVKANTALSFNANEAIQSTGITFVASGCTFGTPSLSGQVATANLVSCSAQGTFSLTVTVKDTVGNAGSLTISYVYDTTGPTFTPSLTANNQVGANTALSFTANEAIQSTSITFVATGCTFGTPTLSGLIATANLVSCSAQGAFSLTVTALDTMGNSGSLTISYVYDSAVPTLTPSLAANSKVKANTALSFTANKAIQSTGITFVASGCTFGAPSLSGQTVTANLVSCTAQGTLSLTVTVKDTVGNSGSLTISYVYDSVAPTLAASTVANSKVKTNSPLSFTANEAIKSTGITFVASGRHDKKPLLATATINQG